MKEIFCAVIVMFVMCTGGFAASEDMSAYVRKDVFDAKMEMLFLRLHSEIENLGTRLEGKIDALSERIDGLEKRMDVMDKRMDDGFKGLDKRIDEGLSGVNKRIDDTHNFLYLLLVLFGAIFVIPSISKFWELRTERKERKTHFTTVEDVRRIVSEILAENNAKIKV